MSRANRVYAKPWSPRLVPMFDDQNDICLSWVGNTEVWAVNEQKAHTARVEQADIVAVGHVRDVLETGTNVSDRQVTLHFEVMTLLRGATRDLPDGTNIVRLPLSKDQEDRLTKAIRNKTAVLFLRWVKGGNPLFHWHITCATRGVTQRTQSALKVRKRNESALHN